MIHGKVKTIDEKCICPEGGSLMGHRCSRCGGWENICALRSRLALLEAVADAARIQMCHREMLGEKGSCADTPTVHRGSWCAACLARTLSSVPQ